MGMPGARALSDHLIPSETGQRGRRSPNTESAPVSAGKSRTVHIYFAAYLCAVVLIFLGTLRHLAAFALHHESCSHIPFIPLISAYLIFLERKRVFSNIRRAFTIGGVLLLLGIASYWMSRNNSFSLNENDALSWATASIVVICIAGFVICYGSRVSRHALFPLLFLFLMVPVPTVVFERMILLLREGSTSLTMGIFHLLNVPADRNGFTISVPGVTIEVAQECSGIRSTLALFITCLLASYLFLRTNIRRVAFVLLVVPMSVVKNGIRIATLTVLSLYVDPGFLYGRLHHEGGIVFFLLALLLLAPILWLLQKSERPKHPKVSARADTQKLDGNAAAVAEKTKPAPGS